MTTWYIQKRYLKDMYVLYARLGSICDHAQLTTWCIQKYDLKEMLRFARTFRINLWPRSYDYMMHTETRSKRDVRFVLTFRINLWSRSYDYMKLWQNHRPLCHRRATVYSHLILIWLKPSLANENRISYKIKTRSILIWLSSDSSHL